MQLKIVLYKFGNNVRFEEIRQHVPILRDQKIIHQTSNCDTDMHENGKADTEKTVYAIIKKLVPFLEFVKDHPATLPEHKGNAPKIADIITNIETYGSTRNWCISFAVYSEKLLRSPEEGLNRYDWRASLESGILSIEAERRYYPFSVKTLNYVYSFHYNFRTGRLSDNGEKDIVKFIEDVLKYKEYVTRRLPDVETEIEVFE